MSGRGRDGDGDQRKQSERRGTTWSAGRRPAPSPGSREEIGKWNQQRNCLEERGPTPVGVSEYSDTLQVELRDQRGKAQHDRAKPLYPVMTKYKVRSSNQEKGLVEQKIAHSYIHGWYKHDNQDRDHEDELAQMVGGQAMAKGREKVRQRR